MMDSIVNIIEREIITRYISYHHYISNYDVLLSIRKDIINKQVLANQKELLPDIIAFNDALREALRDMYKHVQRILDKMKDTIYTTSCEEMEITATCYFDDDYPALHPIQGNDRQDLWYALCDDDLNPLYADGISKLNFAFPRDKCCSFDSFIGLDCPPPNWNEGLDPELTKDLHLIKQFHNLFEHMSFAITDFIYVRKFRTEINIEINRCRFVKCCKYTVL